MVVILNSLFPLSLRGDGGIPCGTPFAPPPLPMVYEGDEWMCWVLVMYGVHAPGPMRVSDK